MAVSSAQRFRRAHPCPVCAGFDEATRGRGQRCSGFLSAEGDFARCSRDELAGQLQPGPDGLYPHRLAGECACGREHGPAPIRLEHRPQRAGSPAPAIPSPQPLASLAPESASTPRPRPAGASTTYTIRDWSGEVVALHVRQPRSDGSKSFTWRRPGGQPGLGGLPPAELLYRVETLRDAPPDSPVIVCEGEGAANAAAGLGFLAVGTVTGAGSVARPGCPSGAVLRHLEGRSVYLWPDADEVGAAHMHAVARGALAAGARTVRLIRWPESPPKGDAADFAQAGGTADGLRQLMAAAAEIIAPLKAGGEPTPREPDPLRSSLPVTGPDRITPRRIPSGSGEFELVPAPGHPAAGRVDRVERRGGEAYPQPLSPLIEVLRRVIYRDSRGRQVGSAYVLRLAADVAGLDAAPPFTIAGPELATGGLPELAGEITAADSRSRDAITAGVRMLALAAPIGEPVARWEAGSLILPDPDCGPAGVGATAGDDGSALTAWRRIAELAAESPRVALVVGAAVGGLYVPALERERAIFHLVGDARRGKTTAQRVAAAVIGDPRQTLLTFNATAIGLGARLAELGCLPVVIDELGAAGLTAQAEESLAFRIAAGAARTRGTRSGGSATSGSWESTAITSGNSRLAPGSANPGLAARVVNIAAPITRSPDAARELARLARMAHGWPLRWLAAEPRLERMAELVAGADADLGAEAGGVGGTVAEHLALAVAGAAMLGERAGAPGLAAAALAAAREVAGEAEAERLEAGATVGERLLEAVWEDFARQPTRYGDLEAEPGADGGQRTGYAALQGFTTTGGRLYVFPSALADIAERAGIADPMPGLRELAESGELLRPASREGRLSRTVRISGKAARAYVFALSGSDPGLDSEPERAQPSPSPALLPLGGDNLAAAADHSGEAGTMPDPPPAEPSAPTGREVAEGLAAMFAGAESEPELRELADAFRADLEGLSPQLRADVRAAYGRHLAGLRRTAGAGATAPVVLESGSPAAEPAPQPAIARTIPQPAPGAVPGIPLAGPGPCPRCGSTERRTAETMRGILEFCARCNPAPSPRRHVSPSPRIPVPMPNREVVAMPPSAPAAPTPEPGGEGHPRHLILATDGRELIGAGESVPLPEPLESVGDLAAAALELAEPGQRVILALHESAHERLRLPAKPTDPAPFMAATAAADVRQVGNSGWRIVRTPAGEVHVMAPAWSGDFRGAADPAELRDALAAFAAAVGWDWLYSGASTVHHLAKRTAREPLPVPFPHPELRPEWQGMAASVPAYAWRRELSAAELARGWVRLFDRSGSYLAAWEGCPLPVGEWRELPGPFAVKPGAEVRRQSGYWLMRRAELEAITPATMPDPFARWGEPEPLVWLTTPLLQLAVELAGAAGAELTCERAWVSAGRRRALEAVGRKLAGARERLTADAAAGSASARLALEALKEAYAGAVAWLEYGPKPPDPLARPDWRRTLLDRYAANVYRNLAAATPSPFGLSDVDCAAFALEAPDAAPQGLRLGTALGAWKSKGRSVPMAEGLAALESGGMHELIRVAGEVG